MTGNTFFIEDGFYLGDVIYLLMIGSEIKNNSNHHNYSSNENEFFVTNEHHEANVERVKLINYTSLTIY